MNGHVNNNFVGYIKMYKIEESKYLKIREALAKHSTRELRHCSQVLSSLTGSGFEVDDLMGYLDDIVESIRSTNNKFSEIMSSQPSELRCPECGSLTILQKVNVSKSTRTGDDSRCVTSCVKQDSCGWQQFWDDRFSVIAAKRMKFMKRIFDKNGITVESGSITGIKMDRPIHGRP